MNKQDDFDKTMELFEFESKYADLSDKEYFLLKAIMKMSKSEINKKYKDVSKLTANQIACIFTRLKQLDPHRLI
jgi:hypothetical protein